MCLAAPSRIIAIQEGGFLAEVESFGNKRTVGLTLVPEAKVGDYVIVHAGFAVQILDEEAALDSLKAWEEILAATRSGS
ncbi:HypC/HybG/HupF family hydrogenase formation chaperone [Heliobacterium gestii]|uniref:HypC/HybG/HupF family hydrogenase formation chaperone n=1 Tax=Heliomicrobium gestii TaxID=2699 RepID=A0A845L8R2_HELGE|nr:HypC/HybG/HupF family hydrogenase formation chaperone [Heliomicrobium gestii]MBM7865734.1 hydrogenase expression/formation protein HypC [Heliomicrobium gestii]MZP41981.1 HypC/HybG/HupF family hydrogenase formation chaperone [Heliomicrobium gestii]